MQRAQEQKVLGAEALGSPEALCPGRISQALPKAGGWAKAKELFLREVEVDSADPGMGRPVGAKKTYTPRHPPSLI